MSTINLRQQVAELIKKHGWKSTATLRQHAANLIQEYGWVQDWEGDSDHGYCLSGALHEAARSHESSGREHDHAIWGIGWEAAKRGDVPPPVTIFGAMSLVVDFNDTPGRTIDEVLEVLEP